jgi:hypothetical protein
MCEHRYFQFGENRIIYLPCNNDSVTCWLHWENGDITREHFKPNGTEGLQELSEDEARQRDPEMFSECIDRPYADYVSLKAFYER